ncbi:MAG TPA: hypothetical protein VM408_01245 [Methylomirabilota bacterium]|nr:hypothetical protein [Methylomirabilota bacterium]
MLTAALALAAVPGLAGSRAPSALEPVPAVAFQPLSAPASQTSSVLSIAGLDAAHVSDGSVSALSSFVEPGAAPEAGPTGRTRVAQPEPRSHASRKPPKYTLRGEATFYDNGTTAMRLPRGTVIVVCGRGGCLERVVTDYGPQKPSRVIDMYRPDFFKICGCPSWSGIVDVTVYVY